MSRADHQDVAAYALGVLDPQDTERFEEHLATCWACAAELETMVPVVGMLSGIDGETMTALEQTQTDPALLDRTLVAVRAHRRRARFRQALLTAAAVVVFGGLTGVGFVNVAGTGESPQALPPAPPATTPADRPTDEPTGDPGPGIGGPEDLPGEKKSATDPGTGVEAFLALNAKEYGTRIDFSLKKLPGPRTCRLVVIRENDTTEVISTWSVPPTGYGTNTNSQPLLLTASTAAARKDIAEVQVQSIDVNGVATPLVTVPL